MVVLYAPLKELAGGIGSVRVEGATVKESIRALEAAHPKIVGRVLDETGALRRHVNIFVEGVRATLDVGIRAETEITIIHAISGGADG